MILRIVAVKDLAADAFNRPFFVPKTAMAVRSFTDEVNRRADGNALYDHPEDYILYDLGGFDEDTGMVEANDVPIMLVRGKDVVNKGE